MKRRGVNFLTKENLDYALTNNYTVLAMWNGNTCKKCLDEFWTIQGLFYSFQRESSVCFASVHNRLVPRYG